MSWNHSRRGHRSSSRIGGARLVWLLGIVSWIAAIVSVGDANAQVGKRSRLRGESTQVQATDAPTPATPVTIGSVQFTNASVQAWKSGTTEALKKALPKGESLYVINNVAGTSRKLREEIQRLAPQARIVEESAQSMVVYANQELALGLKGLQDQSWLRGVQPLTPQLKLTQPLQDYLARIREKDRRTPTPRDIRPGLPQVPAPLPIRQPGAPANAHATESPVPVPPAAEPRVEVTFYLFKTQDQGDVRARLSNAGGTVVASGEGTSVNVLRAQVAASRVADVAAATSVREVTLAPKFIKHNDVAAKIMSRTLPTPPPTPFVPPIDGTGQIVGHSDSGLDIGKNDATLHPAFRGRVKKTFPRGRPAPLNEWSDRGGHGTHTAGSILGTGDFPGIAPKAQLVHQSLDDASGRLTGIPTPLDLLFREAYDEGARIHSNSWGVPALERDPLNPNVLLNVNGGVYGDGFQVDDWTWNQGSPRDMLIVFSAGNDGDFQGDPFGPAAGSPGGPGRMTVTAPGTAKNALTVGASETFRPAGGAVSDHVEDLAVFSSKGPTRGSRSRVKPDVVAPGTYIASAKTQGERVVWQDDVEAVTVHPTAATAWNASAGFQPVNGSAGGALSGSGAWQFIRTVGSTFQDILTTPQVAIPAGHELNLELWVRGNAADLDSLRLGFRSGGGIAVFPDQERRHFADWTQLIMPIPDELMGTNARFVIVAEEDSGLTGNASLAIDNFKLTTFASWGAISSLGLTPGNSTLDRAYTFSGGTSMAAPLTAGAATLVRQTLTDSGTATPSAELIKAILINSADPHRGARPNFEAGWGLVNLRRAIEGDYEFDFEARLSAPPINPNPSTPLNNEKTYDIDVAAGVKQLRATLVWADRPGEDLINDLDLEVISPAGISRGAVDPDNNPDKSNNVEGIDVDTPAAGTWKVRVKAIKGVNLPFAIVTSQIK